MSAWRCRWCGKLFSSFAIGAAHLHRIHKVDDWKRIQADLDYMETVELHESREEEFNPSRR